MSRIWSDLTDSCQATKSNNPAVVLFRSWLMHQRVTSPLSNWATPSVMWKTVGMLEENWVFLKDHIIIIRVQSVLITLLHHCNLVCLSAFVWCCLKLVHTASVNLALYKGQGCFCGLIVCPEPELKCCSWAHSGLSVLSLTSEGSYSACIHMLISFSLKEKDVLGFICLHARWLNPWHELFICSASCHAAQAFVIFWLQ